MNKERGWAARRSTLSSASWKVNFFVILVPLWNGLSTNGDVRSSDNIIGKFSLNDIKQNLRNGRISKQIILCLLGSYKVIYSHVYFH